MDTAESTLSLWKTDPVVDRAPLSGDASCDVCVIGAGIAGLSVAYQLVRRGVRVLVVDARSIGGGETGQTTAHLASAMDDRFTELVKVHGEHATRLVYQSHARAIDEIEATCEREAISCHLERVDGYLFVDPAGGPDIIDAELAAARRVGVVGVERLERAPLPSFTTGPCLRFANQGRFHPLRYLTGLAAAIERRGGVIRCGTFVTHIDGGARPRVRTASGHQISAGSVVVATNSPQDPRVALHSKQAPYRTYAVALKMASSTSVPDALYWDTADPYHYARLERGADGIAQLVVGGEDHRTGFDDDAAPRYRRLELWARERFRDVEGVTFRWSGQVLEPTDFLGFIGHHPSGERNVFVVTGDSGQGMTHGTIAGLLLADLVQGRPHPWEKIYDPARKSLRAAWEYARDGVQVAASYALWLKPESMNASEILPGEGAVVQHGLHKLAVYRDPEGELHQRSAVCTHLGGVVRWNSDAKSWDCPCHGSRFAPTGEVLNGPASCPLRRASATSLDKPKRPSLGRSIAAGAAGGAVATAAMSAFMWGGQKAGLLGEMPPRKIAQSARHALGVRRASKSADDALGTAAHFAFGMGIGAVFAVLRRRARQGAGSPSTTGAAYGATIWAASYSGWVPALGIMPRPSNDRPFRPTTMVLAHLLFGGVLGNVVDRLTPGGARPSARRPLLRAVT